MNPIKWHNLACDWIDSLREMYSCPSLGCTCFAFIDTSLTNSAAVLINSGSAFSQVPHFSAHSCHPSASLSFQTVSNSVFAFLGEMSRDLAGKVPSCRWPEGTVSWSCHSSSLWQFSLEPVWMFHYSASLFELAFLPFLSLYHHCLPSFNWIMLAIKLVCMHCCHPDNASFEPLTCLPFLDCQVKKRHLKSQRKRPPGQSALHFCC